MSPYGDDLQLKKMKARAMLEAGMGPKRVSRVLSVSRTTIYRWIAKFAAENEKNMSAKKTNQSAGWQGKRPGASAHSPLGEETAEQRIARLERELEEARLRADFYDEMINVAEAKFDIQIRKKAGAKR